MAYTACAQKVKVGYDKGADFSKYRTYSWAKLSSPVQRPFLYATVTGTIENELASKGLQAIEKDGDLILLAAGGVDFASNLVSGGPIMPVYGGPPPAVNASMWTGAQGSIGVDSTLRQ